MRERCWLAMLLWRKTIKYFPRDVPQICASQNNETYVRIHFCEKHKHPFNSATRPPLRCCRFFASPSWAFGRRAERGKIYIFASSIVDAAWTFGKTIFHVGDIRRAPTLPAHSEFALMTRTCMYKMYLKHELINL